jgi:hypothetical protein
VTVHKAQLVYVLVIAVLIASLAAGMLPPSFGFSDGGPDW